MDQAAREEKRTAKKRQHKANRRACNNALKRNAYDDETVVEWKDLNKEDRFN